MQRTFLLNVIVLIATMVSGALGAPPVSKQLAPRLVRLNPTGKRSLISEISLSPHGDYLAIDWQDYNDGDIPTESAQIYETRTGKLLPPLGIKAFAMGASFTPDGNLLVGAADENSNWTLQLRDLPSRKDIFTFTAEQSVYCFSNDGRFAVLGERQPSQYSFVLFDLKTKKVVSRVLPAYQQLRFGGFSYPRLSADRKYFASFQDDWLNAWSVESGKQVLLQPRTGKSSFTCLHILGDSVSLRVAQADGTITTYRMPRGDQASQVSASFKDDGHRIHSMSFDSSGEQLRLGEAGKIRFWNADTGAYLGTFAHGPTSASIAYVEKIRDDFVAINVEGTREAKEILVTHLPPVDRLSRD